MWDYIRLAIAAICFILGIFITITSLIGNFKYRFVLNRMHAAALIDTLGILGEKESPTDNIEKFERLLTECIYKLK